MKTKGLKTKDLVNIGIFAAIYTAISFAVMLISILGPILWILYPAIAGITAGIVYMVPVSKVQKMGASLILGLICGLIFFITGECTWVIIVTFFIAGVIAEIVRKIFGYTSNKGNILSCGIVATGFIGSPLPMWLFKETYMKSILEMGMDPGYVEKMSNMISAGSLLGMILAAIAGGMAGGLIGTLMFKKTFIKAGIIIAKN